MVRRGAEQLSQAQRSTSETGDPAWVYLHHVSTPWWAPPAKQHLVTSLETLARKHLKPLFYSLISQEQVPMAMPICRRTWRAC